MNVFGNSVKLNNIKTYSTNNSNTNNIFKNQFYKNVNKIDYDIYEDIDYNQFDTESLNEQKELVKTMFDYTATALTSFVFGALDVVENISDGLIMAGGAVSSAAVSIWDNEEAKKIKETTQKMVQYDWTEAGYGATVNALGIDENISYGAVHNISTTAGTMVGYVALSAIPGGTVVTTALGSLASTGSAAEQAFNSGATFEEATGVSLISGVIGAASGFGIDKIGVAAKGAKSLAQVGGYALAGASIAASEPVFNSLAQYGIYANDTVDESGNKIFKNFGDYYVQSGGLLGTVVAAGIGGSITGIKANKSYSVYKQSRTLSQTTDFVQMAEQGIVAKLTDSDITALLANANENDYYTKWDKRKLSTWAHENFDLLFGEEKINDIVNKINKVDDNYWPKFLEKRGVEPGTLGFVDRKGNMYLPERANEHSAFHELFHQLSEINARSRGLKTTDCNGNIKKITGIRTFYSDGFDSTLANESLTEYLSSKYTDGKLYESIYSRFNVRFWERIDMAMSAAYNQGDSGTLLYSYLYNDTSQIGKFFERYSKKGSYDDFVRAMGSIKINELEDMVSSIEKSVNRQNNSFGTIIRRIFGGK